MRAYTFASGYTFGQLVKLSNEELDERTTPNNDKTFHWRRFHLPLCKMHIVSQLIDLEWTQGQPDDLVATMTRTLSELSLGSFEVVAEQDATLVSDDPTLNEATLDDAALEGQEDFQDAAEDFVYCTMSGEKYHFYEDCKGMNSRPYSRLTLAEAQREHVLCLICKKRKASSE